MNVVFIIPTGVGCAIGGHTGDATPAARVIAQTCDKIILHPNVVNACDINEMPSNALYVEGSILDRFLEGDAELKEVSINKVLVAINPPMKPDTLNAVNAAISTIGMDAEVLELEVPVMMNGWVENGLATGEETGTLELIKQVQDYKFDALAIASPITVPEGVALEYFRNKDASVNPWGAIEAIVSRKIATSLNKPVAHAPIESEETKADTELIDILWDEVVNRRKAPEVTSNCYIHCILKGLHNAPRIGSGISRETVSCMVSPYGVVGRPHKACFEAAIPVIAVKENVTALSETDGRIIYVENYLEAAGLISCMNAGVHPPTVRSDIY